MTAIKVRPRKHFSYNQSIKLNKCFYSNFADNLLFDLILCEKIHLENIPFHFRKRHRLLYIATNRVVRYNESKRIEFFRLLFDDYDRMNNEERYSICSIAEMAFSWYNDDIKKGGIAIPQSFSLNQGCRVFNISEKSC